MSNNNLVCNNVVRNGEGYACFNTPGVFFLPVLLVLGSTSCSELLVPELSVDLNNTLDNNKILICPRSESNIHNVN